MPFEDCAAEQPLSCHPAAGKRCRWKWKFSWYRFFTEPLEHMSDRNASAGRNREVQACRWEVMDGLKFSVVERNKMRKSILQRER
jgi:hypothetical protein